MVRKPKYAKEMKINIVQQYLKGEASVIMMGKETGIHPGSIYRWIKKYQQDGESTFDVKSKNASYTKEFKEKVVTEYLDGKGSYYDLSVIYNLSESVIIRWVKMYNNHIELKDYIPGGDVYMMKSRKTKQKERLEIVKYCMANGNDYKTTAKVYEVPYANVNAFICCFTFLSSSLKSFIMRIYSFTSTSSALGTYTALYVLFAKLVAMFRASSLSFLVTLFFDERYIVVGAKISQSISSSLS